MRDPRNSLVADLRTTAADGRESKAAALYGADSLRERMQAAAKEGFDHLTVPGPDGLDLRETEAARATLAWLDREKLTYRWDGRGGGAATGSVTQDLVVSWKPPAVG